MDFTSPSEDDVDMAMHDDSMLDPNLAAQFGLRHPGAVPPHQQPPMGVPGLDGTHGFGNAFVPGLVPTMDAQQQPQQNFPSVEEYANLMGIKLDPGADDMQPYNAQADKIQANTAYFENLYREQRAGIGLEIDNVTSMTLPAGIGSGIASSNMFVGAAAPTSAPIYDRTSELAFNDMNRLYDPSSGFSGAPMPMKSVGTPARMMHPDLGSHTISPELLSAMMKTNAQNYDGLNEEEKAALLKEEKSRERNRDHSRKSRLRKKEFVESLKHEVQQLQIYQQICEQCLDLIALVSADNSAIFLYSSSAYTRVLGYQGHQLIPGQTSFLDLVHPENVQDVRALFQKINTLGETRRFQFRIKSVEGEYFRAETSARMAEKGVICSTRVDRDI